MNPSANVAGVRRAADLEAKAREVEAEEALSRKLGRPAEAEAYRDVARLLREAKRG